ncbi:GNAT family N-acetyltransferase [Romboutsia weinsteinii]|uniref:GNAT family N-acetyltransferase n=1 Tax=Romboutsia weinsteinii TaxID=2020949 RepID=A0A371IY45_9FIRM|nr:GNAT family N-acetyltransferase [Romboutsia weinsteinii]RDY25415.1 GNAT family N-acetyltransferase [Romboutsia weinsteinii]
MKLTIKKVTEDNYNEILGLRVNKDQEGFIETTEKCLEESNELELWRPVGIYSEDELVGFAMYGLFEDEDEDGRVWLDRFMIGEKYQGNGYGKVGIEVLIKRLYKEYKCKEIFLSVYDNNPNAIKLYKRLGFRFNGELDINGERVMLVDLKGMED